jgi:hypothetical protein
MAFRKGTICLIVIIMIGCSKESVYQCSWQHKPITLNGWDDDWSSELIYDIKSAVMMGLTNDAKNLYITLKISDRELQQKIIMNGLTLWIDPNCKKKREYGLVFPMKRNSSQSAMQKFGSRGLYNRDQEIKHGQLNQKFQTGMTPMGLINLLGEETDEIANNINATGISAMLRMSEDQTLYYEACIPIKRFIKNTDFSLPNSMLTFSVGLETGDYEGPGQNRRKNRNVPGNSGPPQSHRTGGQGKRGVGPGQQNIEVLAEPSTFWIKKVTLASFPRII